MIVLAQICLALAVGLFILSPLYFYRGQRMSLEAADASLRRSIAERKGRLYSQLLDLDFDKDSGKISPEDHARMREETMTEVLAVLADEERLGPVRRGPKPTVIEGGDRVERMIEDYKRSRPSGLEVGQS
ncbi:MAG: hypothetical protein ACM3PF_11390 [Bacteroidota bacterium]